MIYTEKLKLSTIILKEERETITFAELETILWERPANVIYVEYKDKLYGIVSSGDIFRAEEEGRNCVVINKKFTCVSIGEYIKARYIFKEKTTINALPVVDKEERLIGAYTRWNIVFRKECKYNFKKNFQKSVIFVEPCKIYKDKYEKFLECVKILVAYGIQVDIIQRERIPEYIDKTRVVIFIDSDESNGTKILYKSILKKPYDFSKFVSYDTYYKYLDSELFAFFICSIADLIIKNLQEKGVHIIALTVEENERGYLQEFNQKIRNNIKKYSEKDWNIVSSQRKRAFLEEIYTEHYEKQIMPIPYVIEMKDRIPTIKDMEIPFFHVQNGERITVDQPEKYERCIYMFGPCDIVGAYVEDKYTIASLLQAKLNSTGFACKVINKGVSYELDFAGIQKLATTSFKCGDIVICDEWDLSLKNIPKINLVDVVEKNNVSIDWFADEIRHCNHKVNQLFADEIYENIMPFVSEPIRERISIKKEESFWNQIYLQKYFSDFDVDIYKTIGSIVMNCNPFTLGHRYLIEEAKKRVDFLIIFVVEEDKSLFFFEERFTMVCRGVEDLENILVVPSGDLILSQMTFPDYFIKVINDKTVQNIENDVTIFAERIAPYLHITHRFVGEEPEDNVTNEYNMAMKRILPSYGIEVVEIPRKKQDERVISASFVRKCLEFGNWEQLDKLVPKSTKQILFYTSK